MKSRTNVLLRERLTAFFLSFFLISSSAPLLAQTTYFVNDGSTVGDVFTTSIGNNANPGTAALPFATVAFAIAQAADGDQIVIDAGLYAEDASNSTGLNTGKRLSFSGAVDGLNNPISIIEGSLYLNNNDGQTLTDLRFEAAGPNIYLVSIRNTNGITFSNCVFDGNGQFMQSPSKDGINYENGTEINSDVLVDNCRFSDGLYVAINSRFRNIRVLNSVFTNVKSGVNHYGADSLLVENCDFDVIAQAPIADTYCVRFGVGTNNPTANMSVTNCRMVVNPNGWVALPGYYHCAFWARSSALSPLNVNDCFIDGFFVNTSATPIDATCNYWNNPCGPQPGQIISTLGAVVTSSPFLFTGVDASPAVGFTPVPNACNLTTLDLTSTVNNVSCFGLSDGSIDLSVTGGVPPYSYTWSNGATTQDINNLPAGTYNVVVTDTCGSSTSLNIQVIQPAQIALSVTTTNVSCPVNCFGTITATASTGAVITINGAPYNPATQYPAGVYTVTATLPNSSGTGFCTRDTVVTILVVTPGVKYLVIDNDPNKAYYYDNNFTFLQSSPLITTVPGVNAQDVDFNGSFVFVLDGQGRRIFRSNQAGVAATASRGMRSNTGSGINPLTGLKVVGNQAFVVDKKSKAFYGFDLTQLFNGSALNLNANLRIPLANGFAEAIAYDGTFYYILNNAPQAKTVFRFDPSGNNATIQSRTLLTETGAQLSDATGALVDGSVFWVTDRGFDKAYSYNLAALFAGTTGLNATAGRPLNIANISSHGITLVTSASFLRETDLAVNQETPLGLLTYPNPSSGRFSLLLSGLQPVADCIIQITDLSGRLITERLINPKDDQHNELVELDQTVGGTYLVNLTQGKRSQTVRITLID